MINKVTIALATFKRPNMLSKALNSLVALQVPANVSLELLICDNDVKKSAEHIYKKHNIPFSVKYIVESNLGIVFVRNRLLKEAINGNSKYLAFFDDDEVVDKDWLIHLYNTMIQFKAQSVAGNVIYKLPENSHEWLRKRDFYGKKLRKTGSEKKSASTNNVMIDLSFVQTHSLSFNQAFNNSGGEDSFFFRELRDRGGKIVTCAEAISHESVPNTRATEQWILNRAHKNAITEFKRNRKRKGAIVAYAVSTVYGLWLFVCHTSSFLCYPFLGYEYKVFNRRRWSKINGIIRAFKGKDHMEYSVIHGD